MVVHIDIDGWLHVRIAAQMQDATGLLSRQSHLFHRRAIGDILRLSDLRIGCDTATSVLSDFVGAEDNGSAGTLMSIDHDGLEAAPPWSW